MLVSIDIKFMYIGQLCVCYSLLKRRVLILLSSNAKFHHTEINDPSFIPAHLQTAKQQKLVLLWAKSMFNSLIIFSAFHYNLFFVAVKLIKCL